MKKGNIKDVRKEELPINGKKYGMLEF